MSWSNGLTILTAMVVVPVAIKALMANRGRPVAGLIRYGPALKIFSLAIAFGPTVPLLLLMLTSDDLKPDDRTAIAFIILLFLGPGVPLVAEFFLVHHTFGEEGLSYRSPWSPRRTMRWEDVTLLKWRHVMKWLTFRDTHGQVFRFSPMAGGLEDFAATALRRLPPAALQASPTGAAALELMRRGQMFGLAMSQLPPEQQLRDLPPEGRP